MQAFLTSLVLSALCIQAYASPTVNTVPDNLVVVNPTITNPVASTVWVVGNVYNVTWETSNLPPLANTTNSVGMVVLGQYNGDGEKLYLDSPLASGILLIDGRVDITVPKVPDGEYMVVVFGSANNASPQFKIVNNPLSSLLPSSSSSSSGSASGTSSSGSAPSSASTSSSVPLLNSLFSTSASTTTNSSPSSSGTRSATSTSPSPPPSTTSNAATSRTSASIGIFGVAVAWIASIPFLV